MGDEELANTEHRVRHGDDGFIGGVIDFVEIVTGCIKRCGGEGKHVTVGFTITFVKKSCFDGRGIWRRGRALLKTDDVDSEFQIRHKHLLSPHIICYIRHPNSIPPEELFI